jgi:hypothetical protein
LNYNIKVSDLARAKAILGTGRKVEVVEERIENRDASLTKAHSDQSASLGPSKATPFPFG